MEESIIRCSREGVNNEIKRRLIAFKSRISFSVTLVSGSEGGIVVVGQRGCERGIVVVRGGDMIW